MMLRRAIRKTLSLYSFNGTYYQCSKVHQIPLLGSVYDCPARSVSVTYCGYYSQQHNRRKLGRFSPEMKFDAKFPSNSRTQSQQNYSEDSDSHFLRAESDTSSNEDQESGSKQKEDPRKRSNYSKSSTLADNLAIHSFANADKKDQDTYLECIRMYKNSPGRKIDRTLFIHGALKYMKDFGVHTNLIVYKELLDIFPKEKMVPTNMFQTMFMHYPKDQFCAVNLLEQMEDNGVIPDPEMESMLLNIFGKHGLPCQKYWYMMYWLPKFKHLNPWPVPKPLPDDPLEIAKLALVKISSIDVESQVTIIHTKDVEDSIEKTWIVSAMAPKQSELLLKHNKKAPIFVEGPFRIYVASKCVDYFTLRSDPPAQWVFPESDPDAMDQMKNPYVDVKGEPTLPPSVHEEHDGIIFANCCTGTSMKDSLLSWIRCLQKTNPVLGEIPIIFTLKNYTEEEKYCLGSGASRQLSNGTREDKLVRK
ncbi:hypothetical protein QAD02_021875 [Eretmocerus hayati]|uniref:Uncharacterized protein n=1 Tax=Eretmocerus hayati TaxID=131215 RepID=A0ACC2PTG9_9HYME|nr:hypothetical protein QAD02_021875 [Eretmocerus hayati]